MVCWMHEQMPLYVQPAYMQLAVAGGLCDVHVASVHPSRWWQCHKYLGEIEADINTGDTDELHAQYVPWHVVHTALAGGRRPGCEYKPNLFDELLYQIQIIQTGFTGRYNAWHRTLYTTKL